MNYVEDLENYYLKDDLHRGYSDGKEYIEHNYSRGGAIKYVLGRDYIDHHNNVGWGRVNIDEEDKLRLSRLFGYEKTTIPKYSEQSKLLKNLVDNIIQTYDGLEVTKIYLEAMAIKSRLTGILNPMVASSKYGYGYYKTKEYAKAISGGK